MLLKKQKQRIRRKIRTKAKIKGTAKIPRLCVFRSNRHLCCQLIDDEKQRTLASAKDIELKTDKLKPVAKAFQLGELIAKKAQEQKINKVVFDKSGYKYHGKVKAVAEGARKTGLNF